MKTPEQNGDRESSIRRASEAFLKSKRNTGKRVVKPTACPCEGLGCGNLCDRFRSVVVPSIRVTPG